MKLKWRSTDLANLSSTLQTSKQNTSKWTKDTHLVLDLIPTPRPSPWPSLASSTWTPLSPGPLLPTCCVYFIAPLLQGCSQLSWELGQLVSQVGQGAVKHLEATRLTKPALPSPYPQSPPHWFKAGL